MIVVRRACHAEEAVVHDFVVNACRHCQGKRSFRPSACGVLHEYHQKGSKVCRPMYIHVHVQTCQRPQLLLIVLYLLHQHTMTLNQI